MKRYVYLAGPITGTTEAEANDWRRFVQDRLGPNIKGISPLRCEPIRGAVYDPLAQATDIKFGTPRAITAKNRLDVNECDFVLAYLPTLSSGTLIELGWASNADKPIAVVSDNPAVTTHPVIVGVADWMLPNINDAIDVIHGLFDDYAKSDLEEWIENKRRAAYGTA